jgi:hypothetical protein
MMRPPSTGDMRECRRGTGLEGYSRGNPVMSHGPGPDKLLIKPAGVARTAPGSTERHGIRRSQTVRVTQRHQAPTLAGPSHHGPIPTCQDSQKTVLTSRTRPGAHDQIEGVLTCRRLPGPSLADGDPLLSLDRVARQARTLLSRLLAAHRESHDQVIGPDHRGLGERLPLDDYTH